MLVRVRCRASILGQATAVWIVHVVLLQRLVLHDEQRRVRVCREGRCDDNREGEGEGEGEIEIVALGMRYESASTFSIVPASYCPVSHELQSLDLFLGWQTGFLRFLIVRHLRPWKRYIHPMQEYLGI